MTSAHPLTLTQRHQPSIPAKGVDGFHHTKHALEGLRVKVSQRGGKITEHKRV